MMNRTRMNRNWMRMGQAMLALALTAMVALPASAQDVPLPAQAIGKDAAMLVWVDLQQITPAQIEATGQAISKALPAEIGMMMGGGGDAKVQVDANVTDFTAAREQLLAAGAQGLLIVAQTPSDPQGIPPEPTLLVRVKPGSDPEAVSAAMAAMSDEPAPQLSAYAEGWLVESETAASLPADGNAEQAAQFQEIFTAAGDSPIRIAFRMNEAIKQQLADGQANQMQGNPAAGLMGPLQSLQTGHASVTLGESPRLNQTLVFADAEAARQFNAAWDALLMMGQMMFGQMGADGPKPETLAALFNGLKLQQDGANLTGAIDEKLVGNAAEVAAPMVMMFMMNGMGGGQAPANPQSW